MPRIRVFVNEPPEREERRRRKRAAGAVVAVVGAAIALALASEPSGQPVTTPATLLVPRPSARIEWPPLPELVRTRAASPERLSQRRPRRDEPLIVLLKDAPLSWPELPLVIRETKTQTLQTHACDLTPHVEPRHMHFRGPGRKRVTISNPHDAPIRVTGIDVVDGTAPARGYELSGADGCKRVLDPDERCSFVVKALSVAGYAPVARVAVAHRTP
jgi:hypothetical protein